MQKKTFSAELAYLLGIIILAFGTAWTEAANLGMSMIVTPAYLIYRKLSLTMPFITFGIAEYIFQAILLLVLIIVVRRFRWYYLLSFGTVALYGLLLDAFMGLIALVPIEGLPVRIAFYILGTLLCGLGVALLFHTYIPPEVYDMFVKEVADKFNFPLTRTKMIYDYSSLALSLILMFLFFGFGNFVGVQWGTIVAAFVNGPIINAFSKLLDKVFTFRKFLFRR